MPYGKVKPFLEAYGEVEKLKSRDISLRRVVTNPNVTQIVSLNVSSLQKHIADLSANQILCEHDIICVQETWLDANEEVGETYQLPGKFGTFVSVGRGKGVDAANNCSFSKHGVSSTFFQLFFNFFFQLFFNFFVTLTSLVTKCCHLH